MKLTKYLDRIKIQGGKIKLPIGEINFDFKQPDKDAAWELYIELVTRVTTQELDEQAGDEIAALDSAYSIFKRSRELIIRSGFTCVEFAKLAVIVLNQVLRPFTSKWHPIKEAGAFDSKSRKLSAAQKEAYRNEFRADLRELQANMRVYTAMLAELIGFDDFTDIAAYKNHE